MEEFWKVATLVLFATGVTGVLIAGVARLALSAGRRGRGAGTG